MLVMSRQKKEEIIVTCPNGDRLSIVVADIRGDKVRIGVDAPSLAYGINRKEVQNKIDAAAAGAAVAGGGR